MILFADPEIRNPQIAVLVRSGAERHPARPRHVVLHVHDIHRVAAERTHRVLVTRHVRRRFRQHGIRPEQAREIRRDIVRILIGDIRQSVMHRRPHVFDAIPPALRVARRPKPCGSGIRWQIEHAERSGPSLSPAAELLRLIKRNSFQRTAPFCSAKSNDAVLVRGELHARAGIGAKADGAICTRYSPARQIFDAVLPVAVGEHDRRDRAISCSAPPRMRLETARRPRLSPFPSPSPHNPPNPAKPSDLPARVIESVLASWFPFRLSTQRAL